MTSYPLTPLQQGMLLHYLRAPDGWKGVDVEQLVCTLPEAVQADALAEAWRVVVSRHEVLRTAFAWDGLETPVQVVYHAVDVPFVVEDWRALSRDRRDARFDALLRADRARGFELERTPLLRFTLVRLADEECRLVWTFHHALLDGRCFPMLLREVFAVYDAGVSGKSPPAPPVRRPFREYVEWLAARDFSESDTFWRDTLHGFSAATPIPVARAVSSGEQLGQGDRELWLDAETVALLRPVAETHGVTLNTVIQGAWAIVLARYSGEHDVTFGVASAGRHGTVDGADEMLGLFINTLPLRVRVDDARPVGAWLSDVRGAWNAVRAHEHTPLTRIHASTRVPAGQPLFDSLVMFEGYELEASLQALGGAWARRQFRLHEQNGFPLTLTAYASDRILLRLEFDPSRFETDAIERMLAHVATAVEAIARDSRTLVGAVPILPDRERVQLLDEWAGERVAYTDATLVELLASQVARAPDAAAVEDEHRTLTYRDLDRASTRLARQLGAAGVGRGTLVGISAERSVELVIALVAVLKAGAAYVPIDPEYPAARVAYMLEDSGVPVLLTTTALASGLPRHDAQVLFLDDAAADEAVSDESATPLPTPRPEDAAYMIYTSGSTGRPKGALNAHRGIVNRLLWMQDEYGLGPGDVVLQKTPFSFDVSVWEFFWPLIVGARLVMARPGGHRDAAYLADLIVSRRVSVCHFVPSMLRAFMRDPASARCGTLRAVMASGEALAPDLVAAFYRALPHARLHNLYGPTECAVDVSYWACPPSTIPPAVVPIGKPVANARLYVLDARGEPTPIGVPGELFIGGVQVGLGYHGKPELTAERFVPDHFARADEGANARLYRTGDRARWRPDGTVEYLGRLDFQVKIRGFRIELGEIESALLAQPEVRDCVVTVHEEHSAEASDGAGEKRLVAYVVPSGVAPPVSVLRSALASVLPDYMVPGIVIFLDALPLSSNGKVDRKALPAPESVRVARTAAYVEPRTPEERVLAAIWVRVLRVERVGVEDNFSELGGDSLLSIQIVSQAARAGLKLSLTQALQRPTVAGQASVVARIPTDSIVAVGDEARGEVALTPVQRWFTARDVPNANHWNQAFVFTVPADTDGERLRAALEHVVAHHDAFRLRFQREANGQWRQRYAEPRAGSADAASLDRVDLGAVRDNDVAAEIAARTDATQSSLDLERGPLLRAVFFDLGRPREGRLLLVAHHLVIDAVSWRLLIEDLESAYTQLSAGERVMLPAKTSSFGAWSAALATLAHSSQLRNEASYWAEELSAATTPLPVDHADGVNVEGAVCVSEVSLTEAETRDLLTRVPAAYRTQMNDALLAALEGALAEWMGSGEVLVDVEGHGREDVGATVDVSRTVGWFTSVFPMRMSLEPRAVGDRLMRVKERLRNMPRRGLGFGVLRYLVGDEALQTSARADVLFNYFGQLDRVVTGSRLFRFASESAGAWRSEQATRSHLLEVNALVSDDRLVVRFAHATSVHDAATIDRLAESYLITLRGIIAHCCAPLAGRYTPSDFPHAALDQVALDRLLGPSRDVEDVYPATPLQRLFLVAAGEPRDPGLQQYVFELEGNLDVDRLLAAWHAVMQRHDLLRARFVADAGTSFVVVERSPSLSWVVEDWRGARDVDTRLSEFLAGDQVRGIDPSRAPLMRISVLRTDDARWTLVWTQHHLLLDRWSWPIVLREVGAAFDALRRDTQASQPPATPFRDYAIWQSAQGDEWTERYWREELADVGEPLQLLAPGAESSEGEARNSQRVELSTEETHALRSALRAHGLSLNVAIEGAWAIALAQISGREDVTFGLAVSGRGAEVRGIETIVGVLINNVPVRARIETTSTVSGWLAALQHRQAFLPRAEHASLEDIQRWSGVPWRYRLFESLLVFQDASTERGADEWFGPSLIRRRVVTPTKTGYPITLLVTGSESIALELVCDPRSVPISLREQLALLLAATLRALTTRLDESVDTLRSSLPRVEPQAHTKEYARTTEYTAPRTPTEAVLARIWGEFLGVPELGVSDNFLARGGHSLLATQIVSHVRDTFHLDVPVRALFAAPTVSQFAQTLRSLERKPGQVDRIAQLVERVQGMTAEELRQASAAREKRNAEAAMVHAD